MQYFLMVSVFVYVVFEEQCETNTFLRFLYFTRNFDVTL